MSSAITAAVGTAVVTNYLTKDDRAASRNANNAAADATGLQAEIARDQNDRYKELYLPLERSMVEEAKNAGSDQEYAQAAGDASATVAQQFGKARDRLSRTPGLDPSTPGATAALAGLDMAQAASDATSQNVARTGVKNAAWAKKTGMLGVGKGLDSTAASSLGSAAQGLSAVANANANSANQTAGAVGQFVGNVMNTPVVKNWVKGTPETPVTLGPVPDLQTPNYGL